MKAHKLPLSHLVWSKYIGQKTGTWGCAIDDWLGQLPLIQLQIWGWGAISPIRSLPPAESEPTPVHSTDHHRAAQWSTLEHVRACWSTLEHVAEDDMKQSADGRVQSTWWEQSIEDHTASAATAPVVDGSPGRALEHWKWSDGVGERKRDSWWWNNQSEGRVMSFFDSVNDHWWQSIEKTCLWGEHGLDAFAPSPPGSSLRLERWLRAWEVQLRLPEDSRPSLLGVCHWER